MRTRRLTSALVLLAILVAAGCGSSSEGGGTTTAAEPAATGTTAAEPAASGTTAAGATVAGTTTVDDLAGRVDWANNVCGVLVTWKSDVAAIGTSLTSGQGVSQASLQDAAAKLETATTTLTSGLKDVGAPPTPDGEQAKQLVDQLSDDLNAGVDQIKSDTANVSGAAGFATAATAVAATAASMAGQITSTASQLRSLDANGDWEKAFSQSTACSSLGGS